MSNDSTPADWHINEIPEPARLPLTTEEKWALGARKRRYYVPGIVVFSVLAGVALAAVLVLGPLWWLAAVAIVFGIALVALSQWQLFDRATWRAPSTDDQARGEVRKARVNGTIAMGNGFYVSLAAVLVLIGMDERWVVGGCLFLLVAFPLSLHNMGR